jgi:hypothetical protein
MGWLSANWILIALIGAMLLMHLHHAGMHRRHSGHSGHSHEDQQGVGLDAASTEAEDTKTGPRRGS